MMNGIFGTVFRSCSVARLRGRRVTICREKCTAEVEPEQEMLGDARPGSAHGVSRGLPHAMLPLALAAIVAVSALGVSTGPGFG
jgi:hypothetical protein